MSCEGMRLSGLAGRVLLQRLTKNTSTTSSTTSTRTFSGGIPIISSLIMLVRLVDRAMKREDSSEQGKIVTELMQHLHGCKNNCDVFFGRTEELERMKNYIVRIAEKSLSDCCPTGWGLLQAVCDVRCWRVREVLDAEHDCLQGSQPLASWIPATSLC